MASSSQASTLVNRGGRAGDTTVAPTRVAAGRTEGQKYFYAEDGSIIKLSPSAVIGAAVCFIVFVFILHIFGKLRV
ncbi:hypothetical protein QBZ16_004525 [Prototheca wickerhamii]|uniref:Protein transport protein Sec61 subunit beta n=1 Tax=Prototheca wickerhamii TaxID=3111 RepID=A0AAD9IIE3_PROWI|nr:hypothetical protein QBZ16_004525 [Prototheca wickerhamii]